MQVNLNLVKTNLPRSNLSYIHKRLLTSCNEYIQVPHYREKSALFIKQNLPSEKTKTPIFPRIITPELDLKCIFETENMYKSALSINLNARHIHLDLRRLKEDYLQMNQMQGEITRLEQKKLEVSTKVNQLVKLNGKKARESAEFKSLIQEGINIKIEINNILEDLIPLQEIVQIACLRLPNNIHVSSLLVHALQANNDFKPHFDSNEFLSEENNSIVVFRLNDGNRQKSEPQIDWKNVLSKPGNWSFIEQSHADRVLNNRYLTGEYSKLEQTIVDYVHDKFDYLNSLQQSEVGPVFEHIKSVSMLKTAVIEGSGIYPSTNSEVFNIVSFSGSAESSNNDHIELLHLTGSASLSSLLLNFVRTQIKPKYLPWSLFTNGKKYSPKLGQINKFSMLTLCADSSEYMFDKNKITKETNILDIGSILSNKGQSYLDRIRSELNEFAGKEFTQESLSSLFKNDEKIDQLIIDYLKLFVFIYKDFKIPLRFNFLNANELRTKESLRIKVECFLPSVQNYLTVGEVSLLNEHLSERLQIRLASENKDDPIKHISMIHTTLIDINVFLKVLVESNIKKSDKDGNKFVFELPDQLKKFHKS